MKKIFIALFLILTGHPALFSQEYGSFYSFSPARNNKIRFFDTLRVAQCYNLDNVSSIGIVQRTWYADMWVSVFKNNQSERTYADFDTVNFSDTTRFYFYRSANPSNGIVIIWESRYTYYSELRAYIFKGGIVRKMGKIDVDLDDIGGSEVHYPISAISIKSAEGTIIFTFKKHLVLRISERFDPEDFYYKWDGAGQLLPVKKGVTGKPVW